MSLPVKDETKQQLRRELLYRSRVHLNLGQSAFYNCPQSMWNPSASRHPHDRSGQMFTRSSATCGRKLVIDAYNQSTFVVVICWCKNAGDLVDISVAYITRHFDQSAVATAAVSKYVKDNQHVDLKQRSFGPNITIQSTIYIRVYYIYYIAWIVTTLTI